MLLMADFQRGESTETLEQRLARLGKCFGGKESLVSSPEGESASLKDFHFKLRHQSVWGLQQLKVPPGLHWLQSLINVDTTGGWEGFILRKDAPYKGKRRSVAAPPYRTQEYDT